MRLLQQRMPSARVVYASATAATDPQHVGYCSRLGLWKAEAEDEIDQDDEAFLKGEEPFDTFIDFLKTIRGSGRKLNNSTALMESVAMSSSSCRATTTTRSSTPSRARRTTPRTRAARTTSSRAELIPFPPYV